MLPIFGVGFLKNLAFLFYLEFVFYNASYVYIEGEQELYQRKLNVSYDEVEQQQQQSQQQQHKYEESCIII